MNIRTILFLLVAAAVALPLSAQERRPVYIVNGERYEGDAFREIPPAEIERMEQLPADEQTIERYGSDASNGVILITLKYDSKAVFTADSLSFDRYVARRIKWDATDPVARVVLPEHIKGHAQRDIKEIFLGVMIGLGVHRSADLGL